VLRRTGLASLYTVHPSADLGGPYGFFSGALDEVGVYGRALTGVEIQSICNAGRAGLCKGAGFSALPQMNGKQIQLTLSGRTGSNFRIEASSNLSEWSPLVVLSNQLGIVQFIDAAATNFSQRFYRATPLP
ncbi:MAG: Immunoglobulin I-set domain protein, partial [Pedosphaera sp.]|nr:Immunoglobulin I-set domain protein [Pedosphaera sp.]